MLEARCSPLDCLSQTQVEMRDLLDSVFNWRITLSRNRDALQGASLLVKPLMPFAFQCQPAMPLAVPCHKQYVQFEAPPRWPEA